VSRNRHLFPIFGLLFIFLGCSNGNNSSTDDSNKTELIKRDLKQKSIEKNKSNEINRTIEETFLNEMGFDFKNQKIIIDLNKTKNFFSKMENKMEEKVKEVENKIKNSDINITRDAGVVVSKERVNIDLNRTKNLVNSISGLFKDIILDINKSFLK
jgi:hypothetical protein